MDAQRHLTDAHWSLEEAARIANELRAENDRLRARAKALDELFAVVRAEYPTIAGHVIGLEQLGETVDHEVWAALAKRIYDAVASVERAIWGRSYAA